MPRNLGKPAPIKAEGDQSARRRSLRPKILWYPVVALGVLMMILALRLGVGHALDGHGWQKVGPTHGFAVYSSAPAPKWDKTLATLTSDSDDDDGDDDGDDCPTTAT